MDVTTVNGNGYLQYNIYTLSWKVAGDCTKSSGNIKEVFYKIF